ncbi:MAG: HlyD family efflux transporter periplasmic adaptor subunit [Pirellulaceae bacterium]
MSLVGPFASMPQSPSQPVSVGPPAPDSAPGVDPLLIQQTKNEIRQIVQEITQLSQADITQEQYVEAFLPRIISALAAAGGAMWTTGEDGGLELQYQVNYPTEALHDSTAARARHGLLLRNIVQNGHPTLVPPHSGAAAEDEAGNPSEYLLILAPLKVEQHVVGIVEIFQRAGGGPTTQRGYLRFLVQMAELAGDFLKSRRLRRLGDRQALWEALERFLRQVHGQLDVQATAYTVVNESRSLIQCDRVSLALRHGRRFAVRAVSGLDSLDRRAVEVRLLSRLASVVSAAGQPLWYTGESRDIPPQIEGPLQEYVDHAHAKLVAVLPLYPSADESVGKPHKAPAPLGVLIVERLRDNRLGEGMRERVETVAAHCASALGNALEYQSLFLLPLWRALGKARWVVQVRMLPRILVALALAVALVAALVLVPASFDLSARGKLQPSIRSDVFAQVDGVVVDVRVRHEDLVETNAVLAVLTNSDLDVEYADLTGRKRTTQERVNTIQRALLDDRRISIEERNRLDGELLELKQVEESIDRELELLQQKSEQLNIRSTMAGQVVTWNVREALLRRPVEKGQVLLTVVDPAGPWELELYMPERRMGHVTRAARQSGEGLAVTFTLASHPGLEFTGEVIEMQRLAELHGDEGNSVVLRVAIDKTQLPELRSDTTVTAKVHCGVRAIGYVWFHEVIETFQSKVLFWL